MQLSEVLDRGRRVAVVLRGAFTAPYRQGLGKRDKLLLRCIVHRASGS